MKRIMALTLVIFLMAGCATQGQKAKGEGTLLGAGIGAAIGAGIGALIGGKKGAAIGAGAGAALGALGGYSYASSVEKRHRQLAGKENDLNARIAFAQGINQDTQQYNERLAQDVADLEQHVAMLEGKISRQQITQRELEKERASVRKKVIEAENQLLLASQQLDDLKQFRSGHPQDSAVLDSEIEKLEAQVAQLRTNTTTLASLGQRF
ncbi:MAG: YMGG-like glycine zipper-containing protein [Pseudomonadota bacterium]